MRNRIVVALALAVAFSAAAASAQQPPMQPVTYVADFHVRPGMGAELMDVLEKYDKPIFSKLLKDGAILAWGVEVPWLHEPGGPSHSIWWVTSDMSGMDRVFAALDEASKAEQKKAEEARKKGQKAFKSMTDRFDAAVDRSRHKDWLFRVQVIGFSPQPSSPVLPYTWINLVKALPGKGPEYRQLWEKYTKPVLDKLAKEGAILAYGLDVQEARSTDAFTHVGWVSLPNLAAREKVRAAFDAADQARTPAERSEMRGSFLSVIDPAASRSFVNRAVMFEASAPPK